MPKNNKGERQDNNDKVENASVQTGGLHMDTAYAGLNENSPIHVLAVDKTL